jgi:DNA-binding LacI/PurR family transcriptional regulator
MKHTAVTIKEIARLLGLSKSTVSRALTEHADVNDETRRKVQSVARQLQYEPNKIALNLKQQCTRTIGVIVPETANVFFAKVMGGIQKVANEAGYNVVVCQSNESYAGEKENIRSLIANQVDGLLISVSQETDNTDHFDIILKKNIPVVFFDRICEAFPTSQVFTNNYEISFEATEHLIAQGCRRIAAISGPQHLYHSRNRLQGYKDALRKNGLPLVDDYIISHVNHPAKNIEQYTKQLISLAQPPDAIFAINDIAAIEMMHIIKQHGLKIPVDIAMLGFNNETIGNFVEPSLSTIHLPASEMGTIATQVLLAQISDINCKPQKKLLKSSLVVRESTSRVR